VYTVGNKKRVRKLFATALANIGPISIIFASY